MLLAFPFVFTKGQLHKSEFGMLFMCARSIHNRPKHIQFALLLPA